MRIPPVSIQQIKGLNLELATETLLINSRQVYRASALKHCLNSTVSGERVAPSASPAQHSKKIYTTPAATPTIWGVRAKMNQACVCDQVKDGYIEAVTVLVPAY